MKKILFTIIALCSTLSVGAQNELQTAVLQHDGDTQVFIGRNAFANANAAAVDGDVITLSADTFNIADITKSISLYGAGFEYNNETGTQKTSLIGTLKIGVSGQTLANVHIEGIYTYQLTAVAHLEGFVLNKCQVLNEITLSRNTNTTISNCQMYDVKSMDEQSINCLIKNSHSRGSINRFGVGSTVTLDHCIVEWCVGRCTCTNSIFLNYDAFKEAHGANVTKCIIYKKIENNGSNTFTDCWEVNPSNVFTDVEEGMASDEYTPTRTFELKQPETWIGTDGQEVGIRYGWSKVPNSIALKNVTTTVSGNNLNVTYTK